MKITEKRTLPAHEYNHLVAVVCDLCKTKYTDRATNWGEKSPSRTLDTKVYSAEESHDRDGGGYRKLFWFDICPACFRDRLVPWMKSQGAEPTIEETDH